MRVLAVSNVGGGVVTAESRGDTRRGGNNAGGRHPQELGPPRISEVGPYPAFRSKAMFFVEKADCMLAAFHASNNWATLS